MRRNPDQPGKETPLKATCRNSGESKNSNQTESKFQSPITSITDIPSDGKISSDGQEFLCKTLSVRKDTAAQMEEVKICAGPSIQNQSALDVQNTMTSKNLCPKENKSASVSEPASDNNKVDSKVANYSLHENTSDAEEVKLCSSDPQQPEGKRSYQTNQSSHGTMNDPDQPVSKSPSDKESSTVIYLHTELHQIPGGTSEEPPRQLSSKTGHGLVGESPINYVRENPWPTARSLSQQDTGITQVATVGVGGDGSQSPGLCWNLSTHKSKTSDSNVRSPSGGSDFNKWELENKADFIPEAVFNFKKRYGLKPLSDSVCPAGSGTFEHQTKTSPPKLKTLDVQRISIAQEEPEHKVFRSESPPLSDTNSALDQFTKFQPIAIMSSFLNLNKQLDGSSCHELSRIGDRTQNAAQHGLSRYTIQTLEHSMEGSKSSVISQEEPQPSITQRTYIDLQLSLASGLTSPVVKYGKEKTLKPTKESKMKTHAKIASKLSPISRSGMFKSEGLDLLHCTKKAQFTAANGPKPSHALLSDETLKFSTFGPNVQTVERWSLSKDVNLSADYKPFSVRHKIKSFESLANLDKPVAKSSAVHTFSVAYTASLNQRIAGYIDLVNSVDWQGHQRDNSWYDCLTSVASLPPPLSRAAEDEDQKGPDRTTSHTSLVLRRKHGRLPTRKVHQLRALSMPDLEKICGGDFSGGNNPAVNKNDPSSHVTFTPKAEVTACLSPTAMLRCGGDASSEDTPKGAPETREPGWSIRLKELVACPVSQCKLQTLLTSDTAQSYVTSLLEETKTHSKVINSSNTHLVVLSKEEGAGLGFSIAGGVDVEQGKITVHHVFTKGAASLEGTIQSGDTILSINGTRLQGKSHVEVLSCLNHARFSKQALVVIWRTENGDLNISEEDYPLQTKNLCSTGQVFMEAEADIV
ncbi:uncharacterized protein LOC118556014 isoform X1 [Fundulus heteroclitus]|uniref:uncharacterized protein LOC118556014 isoform X1 n=1 Tax=Fundulus heteroclitus TaxID=8078 RepID=UPI00165ACCDA|nr:uncharacterized protein LOC118556014 isoform X1 [Fundulus heteroclitus]XP_035986849.1 uncharacterized protein LOC118556014 isoform X1 [Fundulus heteroclitus]